MRYLILCDMDGTLLNNQGGLSEFSINVIKRIATKHHFCLVTSNNYTKSLDIYNQLNLTTYLACENGGLLINPSDHICEKHFFYINSSFILQIFNELKHIINSAFYKVDDEAFCYNYIDRYSVLMSIPRSAKVYCNDFNKITLKDAPNMYIIISPENVSEFEEYFKNKRVNIELIGKDANRAIFLISHPKSTKLEATNEFKKFYAHDKVIAIGDSINDVEMLKGADISLLMKNASIKSDNFTITEFNNNEDGVAKELLKIIT